MKKKMLIHSLNSITRRVCIYRTVQFIGLRVRCDYYLISVRQYWLVLCFLTTDKSLHLNFRIIQINTNFLKHL